MEPISVDWDIGGVVLEIMKYFPWNASWILKEFVIIRE